MLFDVSFDCVIRHVMVVCINLRLFIFHWMFLWYVFPHDVLKKCAEKRKNERKKEIAEKREKGSD